MYEMDPRVRRQRLTMMCSERSRRRPITAVYSAAVTAAGLTGIAQAEQHTFELNAPDAHYVYLAGEMTQWDKSKLRCARKAMGCGE